MEATRATVPPTTRRGYPLALKISPLLPESDVEMEAAAVFAIARVRGVRAGLIAAVSDELFDVWNPAFSDTVYLEALIRAADASIQVASQLT